MFEWLKRLVARRELAELEELRREARMLNWARAENHQLREMLRERGWVPEIVPRCVPPKYQDQNWIKKFADDWRDASYPSLGRCIARFDHPIDLTRAPYFPGSAVPQRDPGVDY
ncbi:hypothetical protein, partial [Burkholderia cenocepacia]|uniref:hypothetical protein n=2 Tax=Burkholderia TaxID=32008 RepID=UPI000664DFC1